MPFYRATEEEVDFADGVDFLPEDVPRAVVAVGGYMVTKGMELAAHSHRKAEVILTLRGVVKCEADQGVWIVPPRCAVWIPEDVTHSVTFAGDVEVYVLMVEPGAAPALPRQCSTLGVSPLLERLLLHATEMPVLYDVDGADGRIATVSSGPEGAGAAPEPWRSDRRRERLRPGGRLPRLRPRSAERLPFPTAGGRSRPR